MTSRIVFVIIGKNEQPLYELEAGTAVERDDLSYLQQFILHSSLDMLEKAMANTSNMFLKVIDRFNNYLISAYVTPGGGVTMMLLHSGKNEDAVRAFFTEVNELYARYMLNPFSTFDAPIVSPSFDITIRTLAKRILNV